MTEVIKRWVKVDYNDSTPIVASKNKFMPGDVPVIILPVEGDNVGPFEKTDIALLKMAAGILQEEDGMVARAYSDRVSQLSEAIASLFKEGE